MSFCCKCKAGICKTADCDSVCDCHPPEYPNDKETQDWMNAPLGRPEMTPEEQVLFWSDKFDHVTDQLHSANQMCVRQMRKIDDLTKETFELAKTGNQAIQQLEKKISDFDALHNRCVKAECDLAATKKDLNESIKLLQWIVDNVPSEFWRSNRFRGEVLSKIGEFVYGEEVKQPYTTEGLMDEHDDDCDAMSDDGGACNCGFEPWEE